MIKTFTINGFDGLNHEIKIEWDEAWEEATITDGLGGVAFMDAEEASEFGAPGTEAWAKALAKAIENNPAIVDWRD